MTRMPPPAFLGTARLDRFLPHSDPASPADAATISLVDLPAMIWRQRWLLVGIIGIALLLGLALVALALPRYTAEATVRIDNEPVRILEGQDLGPVVALADTARHLNTQVRTVTSRSLAAEVADALHLDRSDAFLRRMAVPLPDETVPAGVRRDRVIAALQASVAMQAQPDSRVATIAFTSPDPSLSARIANAYADRFIDRTARERSQTNAYARRMLAEQVQAVRAQLLQTEQATIAYTRHNRLIDAGAAATAQGQGAPAAPGSGHSLTTGRLVELNRAQAAAQAARIAAEARWNMARHTPALQLPEAQANATVQGLLARRAGLAADLAQLRARYREGQPEVQEKASELQQVDSLLASAAAGLAASMGAELHAARAAEQGLSAASAQLAHASLDEQERRVRLDMLMREADTQRRQLDDLMSRLNQVQAASDLSLNTVTLLDRAVAGVPTGPGAPRMMLFALAAGLVLALLAAVLREALDDTLRTPADAARRLQLRLLGTTPRVPDAGHAGAQGADALAEACGVIQATVEHLAPGAAGQVLLVAASTPGEGASTTALALARSYARAGRRVLLVDADLRQPPHHEDRARADDPGFAAVLMQGAPFAPPVVEDASGLYRLPAGLLPADPVPLLASGRVAQFIADQRRHYDLILFDAAPVAGRADTLLLARHADFTLLAVGANRARAGLVRAAARRLEDAGATVLGFILTGLDPRASGWSRPVPVVPVPVVPVPVEGVG